VVARFGFVLYEAMGLASLHFAVWFVAILCSLDRDAYPVISEARGL